MVTRSLPLGCFLGLGVALCRLGCFLNCGGGKQCYPVLQSQQTLCSSWSTALCPQAQCQEEFRKTPGGLLLSGEVWKTTSEGTLLSGLPAKPGHPVVTAQWVAPNSQGVVRSVLKENKPYFPVCVYAQQN